MKPFPSVITSSLSLPEGVHLHPDGLIVEGGDITLNGNGAHLIGQDKQGRGISVRNARDITIENIHISNYHHGIYVENCEHVRILNCTIRQTGEIEANTVFLDIWLTADRTYGGAIILRDVKHATITGNDLQHQMCGLLSYECEGLNVRGNNASYNSGFGFHLFGTRDSRFENNYADYCNRWQPRDSGGHLGADASGFLLVGGSSDNVFRDNFARLGGDGFFISGLSHAGEYAPCNNNLFEGNDVSHSPNNGFESTFSAGNVFRGNNVTNCNYGFWLGFSKSNTLENNQIKANRSAGLAVENGFDFTIRKNEFTDNRYGVLAWSKYIAQFAAALPENNTSYNWRVEDNRFTRNHTGVRIAANQNHGIQPHAPSEDCPAPHDHRIEHNEFIDNQIAVEVEGANTMTISDNHYTGARQINLVE
jgi:parallel beta-helix repeat protein